MAAASRGSTTAISAASNPPLSLKILRRDVDSFVDIPPSFIIANPVSALFAVVATHHALHHLVLVVVDAQNLLLA